MNPAKTSFISFTNIVYRFSSFQPWQFRLSMLVEGREDIAESEEEVVYTTSKRITMVDTETKITAFIPQIQ